MKKKLYFILDVLIIEILLFGCTHEKSIEDSISFHDVKEPYVFEWGEKPVDETFFSIDDDIQNINVLYNYDEHKLDQVEEMKIDIYVEDALQASKIYKVMIKDTKPPIIEYNGETEIAKDSAYEVDDFLTAYDMMGEIKMDLKKHCNLENFCYEYDIYKGNKNLYNIDTSQVGKQEIRVYAKDRKGNMSTKMIIVEVKE